MHALSAAPAVRDVVIVGAGIAGLTVARALRREGRDVTVLERARGVGGRCATRRTDGGPVDHGLTFLHGRSPQFRAELEALPAATRLVHWPIVIDGDGTPCRPEAFGEHEYRVACTEGVNRFARVLAADVPVRLNAEVTQIRAWTNSAPGTDPVTNAAAGWDITLASGESLRARVVVLTLPAPSALDLLRRSGRLPEQVLKVMPLIALVRLLPCLAVLARYEDEAPRPAWDVSFPRGSAVIHSVTHDSRKRAGTPPLTLVLHARPAWSRAHQDDDPESWAREMLAQAAAIYGGWMGTPLSFQAHRWRRARVDPGSELTQPVAVQVPGGAVIAFAGDGFHHAGGVEGAYLSGLALARRLQQREGDGGGAQP